MTDDWDRGYELYAASMVKHCRCCRECANGDIPCAGVLAGGTCDETCWCDDEREYDYDDEDPDHAD